jgi:hypothetical protein
MPEEKKSALKKRIAPSLPLKLELVDDNGSTFTRNFRLSFDFNALARIQEKTGIRMLGLEIWGALSASVLSVMFWASVLANQPDYNTVDEDGKPTDEGLEVIRSYMDMSNADQISDACWDAFLLGLPKDRAEKLREMKKEAERIALEKANKRARGEAVEDDVPNAPAPALTMPADPTGSSSMPSPELTSASAKASSAS